MLRSLPAVLPFVAILLCIAILPLIHSVEHWWHQNRNKLFSAGLAESSPWCTTCFAGPASGTARTLPTGLAAQSLKVLDHAVLDEYIPFIVLLFSLYTISGGIQLRGDLRATPADQHGLPGAGATAGQPHRHDRAPPCC